MAETKTPDQTTSSEPRSVYSLMSDLSLLLGDAGGEVARAHTILGRGQNLSEEDWVRVRGIVFECADKMRAVETTRNEGARRAEWDVEWDSLTPLQVVEKVCSKEISAQHSGGTFAAEIFAKAYAQLDSRDRKEIRRDLADTVAEYITKGEFEKAKRLNDLVNSARV